MLQLWKNYSYAIILVILSFILGLIMIFQLEDHSKSYQQIIVSKGQSLWEIADMYKKENEMTQTDFIKWVQDKNQLRTTNIRQGQTIVIPVKVKTKMGDAKQLAYEVK
jgi:LysM repeat protein